MRIIDYIETLVFLLAYGAVAYVIAEGLYRCARHGLRKKVSATPKVSKPLVEKRQLPDEPAAPAPAASPVKPHESIYKRRFRGRTAAR